MNKDFCLLNVRPGRGSLTLAQCRGNYYERFVDVTSRSSNPSSDRLVPLADKSACVTFAGNYPAEDRNIAVREGCGTQWIHYAGPPSDGRCHLSKFKLRGTNLCAGSTGDYVYDADGRVELMSCNKDEAQYCRFNNGQVQAKKAFNRGTVNGFWEQSYYLDLQNNAEPSTSQAFKFKSNGKIRSQSGKCVTLGYSRPQAGEEVMTSKCSGASRWDVIDVDGDDDDDSGYTICKFKLKKSGGLCAGNLDHELHLMSCDDDDTRMRWYKNGQIQTTVGRNDFWESCPGSCCKSPPSNCELDLQNPVDNGEQEFVLSGTDLVLKGRTRSCVTYEGNYPNAGDSLHLEACDDVTNTRWVAKCDD